MMDEIKVKRTQPAVRAILAATFPHYKGRKVRVSIATRPVCVDTARSGGTWDEAVALRYDGEVAAVPCLAPWDSAAVSMANDGIAVPEDMLLVVRSYFCGVDCGITIHVAAATLRRLDADGLRQLTSGV